MMMLCYGHRFAEEAISRIKKLGVPDIGRYVAIDPLFYKVTGARDICPYALSAHALLHRKSWLTSLWLDVARVHTMSLCAVCQSIDHDFSPAHDNGEIMHLSIDSIETNARAGCPFCTCLMDGTDVTYIADSPWLSKIPVVLRRATIDAEQALAMCIGIDDLSHTYFFRIPGDWGLQIPSHSSGSD
ncbi:hypothetical protein HBI95_033530 [Parastagonospora nodorum]|nr:hypothetical protein HBI10_091760 [Parastagonospora nodorum]KAH4213840.1 hypothetical protein HBI95_033530 [Parastagonospora nodorum]